MSSLNERGVRALLYPRNVVIVGASERRGSWARQVWANLTRFGYPHPIYPVNPRYQEVWGVPCYPEVGALPEPPDHLVVVVPADQAIQVVEQAAAHGARSATIFASGFGEEGSPEGKERRRRLEQVIARTGIAVSGPNCLGNLSAPAQVVTLTETRLRQVESGPVAIVGQSGGLVMALNRTLSDRGMAAAYMVTSGNEIGLKTADYLSFFAEEEGIRVILLFSETIADRDAFLTALDKAREAGKPVVAVKIGGSEAGRRAAQAHTGALAGSVAAFDAVTRDRGLIRVDTLDEMIELAEYFAHARLPQGPGIGCITFSGGLKGLILENAHRLGVNLPPLAEATESRLRQVLGIGTSLGNPLDSGFTGLSDRELYIQCVEVLADDPNIHVVLAQEELLREPGNEKKEGNLARLEALAADPAHKPIAMLSMLSHSVTDYGRELRRRFPHLPFLQDVEKGLRAVQRVADYAMRCRRPAAPQAVGDPPPAVLRWLQQARAHATPAGVVSEVESDALLRLYQIPVVAKVLARSEEEAVSVARGLGFPVVLKVVSADLPHKTEVGGVMVNLGDEEVVRRAWQAILERVLRHVPQARVEGMLVAPHLQAELEVVLGVHRDPEMGPVVMVGAGGTAVELDPDVAFAPPGLNEVQARECLERTRLAKRLGGFRGTAPLDSEGLVRAMVKLGQLALEVGERLESLDINPVFLRRDAPTVVAVDSLAILAASGGEAR